MFILFQKYIVLRLALAIAILMHNVQYVSIKNVHNGKHHWFKRQFHGKFKYEKSFVYRSWYWWPLVHIHILFNIYHIKEYAIL